VGGFCASPGSFGGVLLGLDLESSIRLDCGTICPPDITRSPLLQNPSRRCVRMLSALSPCNSDAACRCLGGTQVCLLFPSARPISDSLFHNHWCDLPVRYFGTDYSIDMRVSRDSEVCLE
jgi:hypothetical protein